MFTNGEHKMAKQKQVYFQPGELAQKIGKSRRFITKQIELGKLKATRVGTRSTLVHESDFMAWLDAGRLPCAK